MKERRSIENQTEAAAGISQCCWIVGCTHTLIATCSSADCYDMRQRMRT
jgi:hypothetical protein